MLKSKHYAEFWDWYLKPVPTSMIEEAALKVIFLDKPEIERNKVFIDWLTATGHDIEYLTAEGENLVGMVNYTITETHTKLNDLYNEIIDRCLCDKDKILYVPKIKKQNIEPMREILYSVDSKGKIREFDIELSEVDGIFIIARRTGLRGGAMVEQPVINITTGKVKRTPEEQARLQYDAFIKKQKDKGYKSLADLGIAHPTNDDEMLAKLGSSRTSSQGYNKPMGAKDLSTVKSITKMINGEDKWIHNDKIDGIRTTIHLEGDDLIFKSRGGGVFKGVTIPFKDNENLKTIIKEYNCEIDGEFYKHGLPLNIISGACRLDDYVPERHDILQLYIFDIAESVNTANARAVIINTLEKNIKDEKLVFVKQTPFYTMEEFDKLHASALERGFEGSIIKRANDTYQFGKKSASMWKRKDFQDEEFEVIGWEPGTREIEDMVFKLKTKDGVEFKAKPQGDLDTKTRYVENIKTLIGQYGTVKFFYYTTEGVPFLPSFVTFRPMKNGKVTL